MHGAQSLYKSLVVSWTDDIITTNNDKGQFRQGKEKLIQHLRDQGWTINDAKHQAQTLIANF